MKQNVIVIIAACLIALIGAATAQAQTAIAAKGTRLIDAINDVVEQTGLTRLDTSGLPLTEALTTDVTVSSSAKLPEIMDKLLRGQYRWEILPDSTLKISRASEPQQRNAPTTPTGPAATDAPLGDDCALINCFGLSPELIRVSATFERQNRAKDAVFFNGLANAVRQTPVYYNGGAYAGTAGMQYGYGYDLYNPFAYRWYENQEKYGLLKVDGPDGFLQKVRVLVDGADVSVGSKANNKWNGAVVLTTGPHIVEFVREDNGGPVAFKRQVNIIPMSVQTQPTWLRVSGNEFKNARELYRYQQHVLVEK